MVRRQGDTLDDRYVLDWLRQFEMALDDSTLVATYRRMRRQPASVPDIIRVQKRIPKRKRCPGRSRKMHDSASIPWLLAARTPSIRYLTLRRLLGRPEDDADVRARGGRWPRPARSRRSGPGRPTRQLGERAQLLLAQVHQHPLEHDPAGRVRRGPG